MDFVSELFLNKIFRISDNDFDSDNWRTLKGLYCTLKRFGLPLANIKLQKENVGDDLVKIIEITIAAPNQ